MNVCRCRKEKETSVNHIAVHAALPFVWKLFNKKCNFLRIIRRLCGWGINFSIDCHMGLMMRLIYLLRVYTFGAFSTLSVLSPYRLSLFHSLSVCCAWQVSSEAACIENTRYCVCVCGRLVIAEPDLESASVCLFAEFCLSHRAEETLRQSSH